MQIAAKTVREEYEVELPADYEKLLTLKGIGHYTAGAMASIAYGIPVPAVDGNVLRVITRITADDTDIMKQAFRTQMEQQSVSYTHLDVYKRQTKMDKLKRSQISKHVKLVREGLGLKKESIVIPFSATSKQGRE